MININQIIEQKLKVILKDLGYDEEPQILISSRPDLGEFQYNGVMGIAKTIKANPLSIAEKICFELEKDSSFVNINIAGPGFINISLNSNYLIELINQSEEQFNLNKTIFLDYGGANVAKSLHVGHLRSANIGEALKRLATRLGYKTISDAHLGDWGRPMGLIILEIKNRYPHLSYFQEDNGTDDFDLTNQDLEEIYPYASNRAKEDDEYLNAAKEITMQLQNGHSGYLRLWNKIINVSKTSIKKIYDELNTTFDLFEGESDSQKYIELLMEHLNEKKLVKESDGALIIELEELDDNAPMPPLLLKKTDGAILYATTELATIYSRIKNYQPDEIWYIVDNRQSLHFKQVFRAVSKSQMAPQTKLEFLGFGTMNNEEGKPFKTRDGNVMTLESLLNLVTIETEKRLNQEIKDNRQSIARSLAIATIKYADLLPNRSTDYVFEPQKFSELEGKTAPYLLYSVIRIKSLIKKGLDQNIQIKLITNLEQETAKSVALTLIKKGLVLEQAFKEKSLNEITNYLYELASIYNRFYQECPILIEKDESIKTSWFSLSNKVLETMTELLNILAIDIPEKM